MQLVGFGDPHKKVNFHGLHTIWSVLAGMDRMVHMVKEGKVTSQIKVVFIFGKFLH